MSLTEDLERRVSVALGRSAVSVRVPDGGHTRAVRGVVTLDDGTSVFAKLAGDERTRQSIGVEIDFLVGRRSAHLPRLIHHETDLLIVEDLSTAQWPPPPPADLTALWGALEEKEGFDRTGLPIVAEPPNRWLELETLPVGFEWLDAHRDRLAQDAGAVSLEGNAVVHGDLGFSNLCIAERGPVLIDWEFAAIGNADLDLATLGIELVGAGVQRHLVPLDDPGAWMAKLAGGLLAGLDAVEWSADPDRLRQGRSELAVTALEWWAAERGVVPPSRH